MPKIVTASDGDVIDALLFAEHGSTRQLVDLLEANRGLAARPFILAVGDAVAIPDKTPEPQTTVRLYD